MPMIQKGLYHSRWGWAHNLSELHARGDHGVAMLAKSRPERRARQSELWCTPVWSAIPRPDDGGGLHVSLCATVLWYRPSAFFAQ